MAPDSNSAIGLPLGPSRSTIAGMRLLGLIFRNSGLNWSPSPMSTACTVYGRPLADLLDPRFDVREVVGVLVVRAGILGPRPGRDVGDREVVAAEIGALA